MALAAAAMMRMTSTAVFLLLDARRTHAAGSCTAGWHPIPSMLDWWSKLGRFRHPGFRSRLEVATVSGYEVGWRIAITKYVYGSEVSHLHTI